MEQKKQRAEKFKLNLNKRIDTSDPPIALKEKMEKLKSCMSVMLCDLSSF